MLPRVDPGATRDLSGTDPHNKPIGVRVYVTRGPGAAKKAPGSRQPKARARRTPNVSQRRTRCPRTSLRASLTPSYSSRDMASRERQETPAKCRCDGRRRDLARVGSGGRCPHRKSKGVRRSRPETRATYEAKPVRPAGEDFQGRHARHGYDAATRRERGIGCAGLAQCFASGPRARVSRLLSDRARSARIVWANTAPGASREPGGAL